MNAAIVTIGDEILIGQIIDTNSAWIAQQLNLTGVQIKEIRSISDNHQAILNTLRDFESGMDLVVLTGGLGPTKDDITKKSLAEYFESRMVENQEVLIHIGELFKKRGFSLTETNRQQAILPHNCIPLKNNSGTAAGMWFERSGTIFVSMPGVPFEMKGIVNDELLPRLQSMINGNVIIHKTIMTQGVPESYLAAKIKDWEEALPDDIKLAYLPRPGIVRLRMTAIGKNRDYLNVLLQQEEIKLLSIISDDVFATEDISLEQFIGNLLKEKKLSLSTAESCTGGNIASSLTSVAGSSAYFIGSVVAYSNEIKINELGVSKDDIENYGAVSEKVVTAMAQNVRIKMKTDFGIATSGIAGPSGGTEEKPVGTTWIAVSSAEKCIARRFNFGEHRGRTIDRATLTSLNMLRKIILGIEIKP
ncbi:MAG: competence/damage-inducible protein A [Bacteroidales bacterium]|nr:competence/damage-inducible protein A [Bacteroidales bacterium]MCF8392175.1 competence/damage-inducible protein A [Bacteroidales bacterium]